VKEVRAALNAWLAAAKIAAALADAARNVDAMKKRAMELENARENRHGN